KCAVSALDYVGHGNCRLPIAKMVGVGGIAPPRLTVSETGPSAVRGEPHAVKSEMKMVLPAGISPATSAFEARRSNSCATGAKRVEGGTQKAKVTRAKMLEAPFRYFSICRSSLQMEPVERLALPWGQRPTVYETVAVATEPHRQKDGLPSVAL